MSCFFGWPDARASKQVDVLISVRKKSFREKICEIFAYYSRGETSYDAFLMEFRNQNHRHFQSFNIKQNNNFRFPCNHVTSFFSEIT